MDSATKRPPTSKFWAGGAPTAQALWVTFICSHVSWQKSWHMVWQKTNCLWFRCVHRCWGSRNRGARGVIRVDFDSAHVSGQQSLEECPSCCNHPVVQLLLPAVCFVGSNTCRLSTGSKGESSRPCYSWSERDYVSTESVLFSPITPSVSLTLIHSLVLWFTFCDAQHQYLMAVSKTMTVDFM